MKYIEVIDTMGSRYGGDTDESFIIAVSEDEYELLKSDLYNILSNKEEYDNVWEAMMDVIEEHGAEKICPDFCLEW